jgi:hypothetical protein
MIRPDCCWGGNGNTSSASSHRYHRNIPTIEIDQRSIAAAVALFLLVLLTVLIADGLA